MNREGKRGRTEESKRQRMHMCRREGTMRELRKGKEGLGLGGKIPGQGWRKGRYSAPS